MDGHESIIQRNRAAAGLDGIVAGDRGRDIVAGLGHEHEAFRDDAPVEPPRLPTAEARSGFGELSNPAVQMAVRLLRAGVNRTGTFGHLRTRYNHDAATEALGTAAAFVYLEQSARAVAQDDAGELSALGALMRDHEEIRDRLLRVQIAGTREGRRIYLREASDLALSLSTACLKAAEQNGGDS